MGIYRIQLALSAILAEQETAAVPSTAPTDIPVKRRSRAKSGLSASLASFVKTPGCWSRYDISTNGKVQCSGCNWRRDTILLKI